MIIAQVNFFVDGLYQEAPDGKFQVTFWYQEEVFFDEYYEEEMSSSEYAQKYMGRPGYSVRKHLKIIQDERKKYRRNY